MKVEQLVVQYLYNNKIVTLQNIGSFIVSPNINFPVNSEKDTSLPPDSITFEYNTKAEQDEGLIDFIVQNTRKIKPLATSDLESYSMLVRQFLNIGKPFIIEGLGVLQKNQKGGYDFAQGNTVNARLEAAPAMIKEKENEEISFASPERHRSSKNGWMIAVVLLFLAGAAATLYYFLNKKEEDVVIQNVAVQDTIKPPVSSQATVDSNLLNTPTGSNGRMVLPSGYNFQIVIKEYSTKGAADRAYARLTSYGHKLILYNKDSSLYKLAIPFTSPLSDTARAKDSLAIFFNAKAYVEN